jgi:hypothetical protein
VTRSELLGRLAVLLGGRSAGAIGEITTGALTPPARHRHRPRDGHGRMSDRSAPSTTTATSARSSRYSDAAGTRSVGEETADRHGDRADRQRNTARRPREPGRLETVAASSKSR